MATFFTSDIIGKTLIAKKAIDIVRLPDDDAPSVYTLQPGESIGTVYSYLLPNQQRQNLYWQFFDSNNKAYYVEHGQNLFDIKSLSTQGVLTLEEKKEAMEAANESTSDKIFRYVKNGAFLAIAAYIAKSLIDKRN